MKAKGSDSANHRMLSYKLESFGLHPDVIGSIHGFLTDRQVIVKVDDFLIYPGDALSGVPQGSVVGP